MGSTVTLAPQDTGRGSDKAAWEYSELVARDKPQMVTAVGAVQSLRLLGKHWTGLSSDPETPGESKLVMHLPPCFLAQQRQKKCSVDHYLIST